MFIRPACPLVCPARYSSAKKKANLRGVGIVLKLNPTATGETSLNAKAGNDVVLFKRICSSNICGLIKVVGRNSKCGKRPEAQVVMAMLHPCLTL